MPVHKDSAGSAAPSMGVEVEMVQCGDSVVTCLPTSLLGSAYHPQPQEKDVPPRPGQIESQPGSPGLLGKGNTQEHSLCNCLGCCSQGLWLPPL